MYDLFQFVTYSLQFMVLVIIIDRKFTSQNFAGIFIIYLMRARKMLHAYFYCCTVHFISIYQEKPTNALILSVF
jgi:hypothetical protein